MDQGIGRLIDTLKKNGQFENTLILYMQDNGGCAEAMGRNKSWQARADMATLPELPATFLQPDMIPKQTRDGYPVRQGKSVMPGTADTYVGYGRSWANVSNTPFREYKHWQHEGGISTPLIAHWPAGISAKYNGTLESGAGHLIDVMATCVDLANATYPHQFNNNPIQALEGISLRPTFEGASINRQTPLCWEHEGNRAIRMGQWKLVSQYPGDWELYDIEVDRTEMVDLAKLHSARVQEMSALWEVWADRVGVKPWSVVQAAGRKNSK
jgi:arylsulfatase A-like enzyme